MLTGRFSFNATARGPVMREVLDRIRSLPSILAAGCGSSLPPNKDSLEMDARIVDQTGEHTYVFSLASATPGYLPAVGARLIGGRDFTDVDRQNGRPVVILSETAARELMPPGSPVGRELPLTTPGRPRGQHPTVIGVVHDIKYSGLDRRADPAVYVPWDDLPAGHPFLVVRTQGDDLKAQSMIRSIVQGVDADLPVTPFVTLDDAMAHSVADRRLRAMIAISIAALALAIATVGLAGSLGRIAAERRRELAIRSSLGATPARIVATIAADGVTFTAVGLVLGLAGSLAAGRALRAFLVGVSPYDPRTLGLVALLVAVVSVLASLLPARRASRVDPLTLLRAE
jgi:putative ABC transport system permease protein